MTLGLRGDEDRVVAGDRSQHVGQTSSVEFHCQGVGVPRPRPEDDRGPARDGFEQLSPYGLPQPVILLNRVRRRLGKRITIGTFDHAERAQIAG